MQCDATKRALDKAGLAHELIDITEEANSLATVQAMGYVQAPVVLAGRSARTVAVA